MLILSFHSVIAAEAAEPFSKDALSIPSLDEDTAIYAGTWVADSEEQAFLLLGNENVMWLAVATQMEDGAYQLIAQSKPVLSYETYCSGSVEMTDRWDNGSPYFRYSLAHEINLYLSASVAGDGTWIVHGGNVDFYEENIDFNFYASSCEDSGAYREASIPYGEDYMLVYETAFPQIEWPIGDNLKLEGFDLSIIQKECLAALEYLKEFDKTHSLGEQDDTYLSLIHIYYRRIGRHFRAARQQQNLKQKDIAELLGVSVKTYSNMERGDVYKRQPMGMVMSSSSGRSTYLASSSGSPRSRKR